MAKKGKRYAGALQKVDRTKFYDASEALTLVSDIAGAKFDETVEAHIKLGVDSRHADQQVRGAVVLPHGTGKTKRVLVFAKGEKAKEAEQAGADFVGAEELVQKIQGENWFDFDIVVATPDMMGVVGRLGRVLGPKVEYRLDKTNIIHVPVGKVSFGGEKLTENFTALMDAIIKAKPAAAKGQYLRSITVASSMGPGVKINPARTAE